MKGGIDRLGPEGLARIGKNDPARRKAAYGFDLLTAAGHERGLALQAGAHVGAELWRNSSQSGLAYQPGICTGDQPQSGGGVGRAASETGGDGKNLGQAESTEP